MPREFVEADAYRMVRDFVRSRLRLAGVLEVNTVSELPDCERELTLLALGDFGGADHPTTAFLRLERVERAAELDTEEWRIPFIDGLSGRPMRYGFVASVAPGAPWDVGANQPTDRAAALRLSEIGETVPLGTLADIYWGEQDPAGDDSSFPERAVEPGRGGTAVIFGDQLRSGMPTSRELRRFSLFRTVSDRAWLEEGDVLIGAAGPRPGVARVGPDTVGAIAAADVLVVRAKDPRTSPAQLFHFLSSTIGQEQLAVRLQPVPGGGLVSPALVATIPNSAPAVGY